MTQKKIPTKTIPFRGGAITNQELSLIPSGGYSAIQNMRMRHPGFEKRTGCRKLHATADSTNEVVTLFQFSKGRVTERHFYAQMGDGDVLEATYQPPTVNDIVITYTTWNTSDKGTHQSLSGGNLVVTGTDSPPAGAYNTVRSIVGATSGKFYWECTITNDGTYDITSLGVSEIDVSNGSGVNANKLGTYSSGYAYANNGKKFNNNSEVSYGNTYVTGDIIGVALDIDNGKIWFSKNGVWQASGDPAAGTNPAFTGVPSGTYHAAATTLDNTSIHTVNFGATAFSGTVPTGFNAGLYDTSSAVFGSQVFSGASGQVPASWSIINDAMLYSNGVDQHQIYPGSDQYVKRVIVVKASAAIPTIPDIGEDYTEQATDVQTTTVVVLDSLGLLDDYDCLFIRTDIPATSLLPTVSAANGNVAKGQLHYWNGAWTAPSGFADGTSVPTAATTYENAFEATTGWTDVDAASTIVASGQTGNCIQVAESGGANPGKTYHDITTVIAQVYRLTYWFKKGTSATGKVMIGTTADEDSLSAGTAHSDATWTKYEIEFTPAATTTRITLKTDDATAGETSLFDTLSVVTGKTLAQTGSLSWTAPTDEIPHYMYNECGFWYRYSLSHGVLDAEVEVSSIQYNTVWQSIQNVWDGIPLLPVEVSVYDQSATTYSAYGAAQVIADLATASDIFYFNSPDPIVGFYIDVGKTPNTTASTTINAVNYFNGTAFAAVSGLYDGTDGLSKSGWVTFGRQALVQPRQFNDSRYYSYWYYFTVDKTLSADVQFSIEIMPYFRISEFGYEGLCNCAWKDRMLYVFARFPNDIIVSSKHRPMVLNGYDYTILDRPGDGRSNRVVCMKKIYNELLVWQEEKGVEGGCLTLYQGYSPETFGKLVLSTRYGTFNAKSAVVVDGIRMGINKVEDPPVSAAFFLSHAGVFMCDGKTVECISDQVNSNIQNYFDPKSSVCITAGAENKMWLNYDSSENCLRIGLVTGSSGTVANVFPVYDISDRSWSFDSLAQPFSCLTNIEAASGAVTALQVAGGTADGTVYQSNYGTDDVSTAIDAFATMEIDSDGKYFVLDELMLRMKAQTGNCTLTPSLNGIAQTAKTLSMAAATTNQVSRRHLTKMNLISDHISLKLQNATAAQGIYLKDIGIEIKDYEGQ
jgi:hypothetical protein